MASQNGTKKRKASRLSFVRDASESNNGESPDWANIDPQTLVDFTAGISAMGGAVRYGYTREGRAYSIGIYLDDDTATFYCRPNDDLNDFLNALLQKLRDTPF